jgi:hypothetical protein
VGYDGKFPDIYRPNVSFYLTEQDRAHLATVGRNNLLADSTGAGRLRYIAVDIERSTFYPLEIPQLIEESLDQIPATAAAITDPFEQA